jgi:hypothetical protein
MHLEKSQEIVANFKHMTKKVFNQTLLRMNSSRKIIQKIERDLQKEEINPKCLAKNKKIKTNFSEVKADLNAKRERALEVMNSAIQLNL